MNYNTKGSLGKRREKPVLIDVDGVVANFRASVADYMLRKHGIVLDRESEAHNFQDLVGEDLWKDCERHIRSPGFARTLPEFTDAINPILDIQAFYPGGVMFVTSPYAESPTWCYDRYMWLKDRFHITRDDIIFARDKRFVDGVTLIDDRWENVLDWSRYRNKFSILRKRPWNEPHLRKYSELHPEHSTYRIREGEDNREAIFFALDNWRSIVAHLEII